jgi:hypothetical protein
VDTLLFRVDSRVGLTENDCQVIGEWLARM